MSSVLLRWLDSRKTVPDDFLDSDLGHKLIPAVAKDVFLADAVGLQVLVVALGFADPSVAAGYRDHQANLAKGPL